MIERYSNTELLLYVQHYMKMYFVFQFNDPLNSKGQGVPIFTYQKIVTGLFQAISSAQ